MLKTIEVVFDGTNFVPTEPVELPAGTKLAVTLPDVAAVVVCSPLSATEAERVLRGDGRPLPWATVEEALGRPRYEP